jgi:hypothetical protein
LARTRFQPPGQAHIRGRIAIRVFVVFCSLAQGVTRSVSAARSHGVSALSRPCGLSSVTPGPVEPRRSGRRPGPLSCPIGKIPAGNAAQHRSAPAINPGERSGLISPPLRVISLCCGPIREIAEAAWGVYNCRGQWPATGQAAVMLMFLHGHDEFFARITHAIRTPVLAGTRLAATFCCRRQ